MRDRGAWLTSGTAQEALGHVSQGRILAVLGIARVGTSYLIREQLIPALEAQGKKIVILAITHVATTVAGVDATDRFAWKHVREGGSVVDVTWVDEISCWILK